MFNKLRSLFSSSGKKDEPADPLPLAVAALLVEAARADESYEDREKHLIDTCLWAQFGLPAPEAAALRAEAEAAQAASNDVHRFTRVVKTMPLADRIKLVEALWRIALSDEQRDAHEDALIRRVCGLIYVSDPQSGAARKRAANALQSAKNPSN